MLIFEIPTGVVADTVGRRASYLLGTVTLAVTTVLYWLLWVWESPFWAWAIVSVLLGLGFTFFSGAVDAWLVDALQGDEVHGQPRDRLRPRADRGRRRDARGVGARRRDRPAHEPRRARSSSAAPCSLVMFVVAALLMRDLGFTPERGEGPIKATGTVLRASVKYGLGNPPVRWLMLASPVHRGRRHLRVLRAAALPARAVGRRGGVLDRRVSRPRSSPAPASSAASSRRGCAGSSASARRRSSSRPCRARSCSSALAFSSNFWVAIVLLAVWGIASSIDDPVHRAYLNDMIPSKQRATVLSFDSLLGSAGGVVFQPILGRSADLGGYGALDALERRHHRRRRPRSCCSAVPSTRPPTPLVEVTSAPPAGDEPATDAATPTP